PRRPPSRRPAPECAHGERGAGAGCRRHRSGVAPRERRSDAPLPPSGLPAGARPGGQRRKSRCARSRRPRALRDVPAVRDLLPFLIVGVTSGSLYGLAATGLVLTFRTSGVFNFAHGAIAAAAAYVFYDLRYSAHLPWPVALVLTVGGLALLSGLLLERLARRLAGAPPVMSIVATVGLLLAIQGLITWHYGPLTLGFPPFLPTSGVEVAGVQVQYGQMIIVAVGLALTGGLFLLLQRTDIGAAMRGVVDDPALVALTGRRPSVVRATSWMIGSG